VSIDDSSAVMSHGPALLMDCIASIVADAHAAVMKIGRVVYRSGVGEPLLVAAMLFQSAPACFWHGVGVPLRRAPIAHFRSPRGPTSRCTSSGT
jgi:hypothetical protein